MPIPGMRDPINPILLEAVRTVEDETAYINQQPQSPVMRDLLRFMIWRVRPGERDFGFQWSKRVTVGRKNFYGTHPRPSFSSGHNALAMLSYSNIGSLLQAAGVIIEHSTLIEGDKKNEQFFVQYPSAQAFVQNANPALEANGKKVRFAVFDGEEYSAERAVSCMAEGAALVGANPNITGHDILVHGVGLLALPNSVFGYIQEEAQFIQNFTDPTERSARQKVLVSKLDLCVDSSIIVSGLENSIHFETFADLGKQTPTDMQAAISAHLFGNSPIQAP